MLVYFKVFLGTRCKSLESKVWASIFLHTYPLKKKNFHCHHQNHSLEVFRNFRSSIFSWGLCVNSDLWWVHDPFSLATTASWTSPIIYPHPQGLLLVLLPCARWRIPQGLVSSLFLFPSSFSSWMIPFTFLISSTLVLQMISESRSQTSASLEFLVHTYTFLRKGPPECPTLTLPMIGLFWIIPKAKLATRNGCREYMWEVVQEAGAR